MCVDLAWGGQLGTRNGPKGLRYSERAHGCGSFGALPIRCNSAGASSYRGTVEERIESIASASLLCLQLPCSGHVLGCGSARHSHDTSPLSCSPQRHRLDRHNMRRRWAMQRRPCNRSLVPSSKSCEGWMPSTMQPSQKRRRPMKLRSPPQSLEPRQQRYGPQRVHACRHAGGCGLQAECRRSCHAPVFCVLLFRFFFWFFLFFFAGVSHDMAPPGEG